MPQNCSGLLRHLASFVIEIVEVFEASMAPSFANLQALQFLLRDAYVADVVMVLGSLDLILGEVDR